MQPTASSTKPSLVGEAETGEASGHATTSPMRMLDGIEAPRGRGSSSRQRAGKRWPLLLAGALVVLALAAWRLQGAESEPASMASAPSTSVRTVSPAAMTTPTPLPTAPPPKLSDATPARDPEGARIEASAEPRRAPLPSASAPSAVATPPRVVARAEPRAAVVTPAATSRAPRAAAPTFTTPAAATRSTDDADVALVRAMLARLSSGTAGSADAPFVNATIGQLAAKCQANAPDDAIAAFECRRQVCADYWGRVEACPVGLAPKSR